MREISLANAFWYLDETQRIGDEGGFGAVYSGSSKTGERVAIKKLHIKAAQAAHREMDIASKLISKSFKHIIPFLDCGQDAASEEYFVVMSIASESLQSYIRRTGRLSEKEAVDIGMQIAFGLQEVSDVVHRDLKPGNVLLHEGSWKIADFGIAKFIADSTSEATLRDFLSPQYAAPEQWKNQRPTSKTDIYALGCIIFEMLTGLPPFDGPNLDDYQRQHLSDAPPLVTNVRSEVTSLVSMSLRKASESRPDLNRIQVLLAKAQDALALDKAESRLVQIGQVIRQEHAENEARRAKEAAEKERRAVLAETGLQIFGDLYKKLHEKLEQEVGDLIQSNSSPKSALWQIKFDTAIWDISFIRDRSALESQLFSESGWDVVLGIKSVVFQNKQPKYQWGANFWYAKTSQSQADYRWWEVSYMTNPLVRERPEYQPFALDDPGQADKAAAPVMGRLQLAAQPVNIDDEDFESFYIRWRDLLAQAAEGSLRHPNRLPYD